MKLKQLKHIRLMKFKLVLMALMLICGSRLDAQESKYIEVTGSAEMLIDPDSFIFVIGIEEYWKEEFEDKKKFEDYKNKVHISDIEGKLLNDLYTIGIDKDVIKSTDVGNYWRYRGKEFLISKRIEITLTDFDRINQMIEKLDRKGIDYMRIGALKHKDLVNYRKDVKKQALLAAKDKAIYLLETLDKQVGDVISITEIESNNYGWQPEMRLSNAVMDAGSNPSAEVEKKIKLRYEIKAKFEIK